MLQKHRRADDEKGQQQQRDDYFRSHATFKLDEYEQKNPRQAMPVLDRFFWFESVELAVPPKEKGEFLVGDEFIPAAFAGDTDVGDAIELSKNLA